VCKIQSVSLLRNDVSKVDILRCEGDGHEETREEEQQSSSCPIHQEHGTDGGQQLDDSDDDRRQVGVHGASGSLEDE